MTVETHFEWTPNLLDIGVDWWHDKDEKGSLWYIAFNFLIFSISFEIDHIFRKKKGDAE